MHGCLFIACKRNDAMNLIYICFSVKQMMTDDWSVCTDFQGSRNQHNVQYLVTSLDLKPAFVSRHAVIQTYLICLIHVLIFCDASSFNYAVLCYHFCILALIDWKQFLI